MTLYTDRNNVKPMFRKITPVVVFLCLLGAVLAYQGINWRQFASSDSIGYSALCLSAYWMPSFVTANIAKTSNFTLFTVLVTFLTGLTFFTSFVLLVGFSFAYFAAMMKPIFATFVFMKFRDRVGLLAFRAVFSYDWFSHLILSFKKNYLIRAGCKLHACGRLVLLYRQFNQCQIKINRILTEGKT